VAPNSDIADHNNSDTDEHYLSVHYRPTVHGQQANDGSAVSLTGLNDSILLGSSHQRDDSSVSTCKYAKAQTISRIAVF